MTEEHKEELYELNEYFQTAKFPPLPIKLNKYLTIGNDPELLINSKVRNIQTYQGPDHVRDSLFKHLRELKAICEKIP